MGTKIAIQNIPCLDNPSWGCNLKEDNKELLFNLATVIAINKIKISNVMNITKTANQEFDMFK